MQDYQTLTPSQKVTKVSLTTPARRPASTNILPKLTLTGALVSPLVTAIVIWVDGTPIPNPAPYMAGSALVGAIATLVFFLDAIRGNDRIASLRGRERIRASASLALRTALYIIAASIVMVTAMRWFGIPKPIVSATGLFIGFLAFTMSFVLSFYERESVRARNLETTARLQSLEAQIRPHFFFNTLNTISALIPTDPSMAQFVLARFATLFRSLVAPVAALTVPLTDELRLVRDYLEIEHARFGQRLRYDLPDDASLRDLSIPPLTLQPLIENAVRHGIAKLLDGGELTLTLSTSEAGIHLTVSNPVDDPPELTREALLKPGHSLALIADRLALLYRGAAQLEASYDGWFHLTLLIPATVPKDSACVL